MQWLLFFSTLASLLKSRNAVMRNDVFTDVVKLYFNRGKIIDHRAKCIAPLSLRVGQRYKHFGTSPRAAWAGERSLVPDPRQTSPRLVLNLPARGETRVLRVAKFCSIKLLYGDLYFVYVFGHLFLIEMKLSKVGKEISRSMMVTRRLILFSCRLCRIWTHCRKVRMQWV